MHTKTLIWIGVFVGSLVGGWLGSLIGGGGLFGWPGLVGNTLGAFAGIYGGFKLGQYF